MEAEMAGAKRVAIDDVKAIVSFMVDGVSNYAVVLCVCAASKSACVPQKTCISQCLCRFVSVFTAPFVSLRESVHFPYEIRGNQYIV